MTSKRIIGKDDRLRSNQSVPTNCISKKASKREAWYFLYFFKVNPEYGRIWMLEMRVGKSFVKRRR